MKTPDHSVQMRLPALVLLVDALAAAYGLTALQTLELRGVALFNAMDGTEVGEWRMAQVVLAAARLRARAIEVPEPRQSTPSTDRLWHG